MVASLKILLEKYQAQPEFYQRILQLKALILYSKSKADFLECVSRAELRSQDKQKFSLGSLNVVLEELRKEKLLLSDFSCNPVLLHRIASFALEKENPHAALNLRAVKDLHPTTYNIHSYINDLGNLRAVHLAVHQNDLHFFSMDILKPYTNNFCINGSITHIFYNHDIDMDWLKTREPIIQTMLCCSKLQCFFTSMSALPPDLSTWTAFYRESNLLEVVSQFPYLASKFLQVDIAMGRLTKVETECRQSTKFYHQEALGTLAFLSGDLPNATRYFESAIKDFSCTYEKIEWFRGNLNAIFYILTHICRGTLTKVSSALSSLEKLYSRPLFPDLLRALLCLKQNDRGGAQKYMNDVMMLFMSAPEKMHFLVGLFDCVQHLIKQTMSVSEPYEKKFLDALDVQNFLGAQLYAELMLQRNPEDPDALAFFAHPVFGNFRFFVLFSVKQAWEYAIDQLQNVILHKAHKNLPKSTQDKRLVWFLDPKTLGIRVAEQKLKKNGSWTDGKAIALKRLYKADPSLNYLSGQDKKAIQGLECQSHGWYHEEHYYWDPRKTLDALIGHPLVLHNENPSVHLDLSKGEIELQVENIENGYRFSLKYHSPSPTVILEQETSNRYRVIDFSEDAVQMSKLISEQGLLVPSLAKSKVIDIVQNAKAGIRIHSEIEEDNIPTIEGNPSCWLHVLPMREGLKINLWVRPFGTQGPYCRAAHGQSKMIALIHQEGVESKQKAIRDFAQERQHALSLIQQCPTLLEFDTQTEEWYFESMETALQALVELQAYQSQNSLHLEWPQGQPLKVQKTKNLSLNIKGSQYWFEYEGEVQLDNDQILELKTLLELLNQDCGRFVQLKNGEFLALTEHFKKQLEELKAISDGNKVYHLSTDVLKDLSEISTQTQFDDSWKQHIKKLKSMGKYSPVIPSTLQAELREYQEEGFAYLSRLARWEIGACLADDMGLGKTVQTIALLLEQALKGPVLVVAPTSVGFIWQEELSKFAPTLSVYPLHHSADRKALIRSVQKMEVLVCSYNLLHQECETLSEKKWQVIVLDEAQAIKNSDSKRSKAAFRLQGNCRIALTGTPIENHLGELWSIFRFLNPGLLGNLAFFQERFSVPIEKHKDLIAKRTLKNLLSPYMLRRTKAEVLKELPEKTEQSIIIEPTPDEMAFYEALRLKALENIQKINSGGNSPNKRFSILAEIARLRQACCHSSLVDESIHLASSKIKTFLEILKDIIENKHKVLVFSQYVRYLQIIKKVLENEKISYQYLDGSTPTKNRRLIVDDFQAGQGDVFLISLKAGGTGLNLTAADYVIILDPWWNPAVEDQASGRAHRMGQQRPVTVYRLIMKSSIEEKIIKLHQDKRNLAVDLLSGSDMSGKITEEELIQLIS